ncbi:MAG: ABC transporter ATP-binding protein [Lachnospiraceae bacterium]|nr:ABC transporter ATP-binding protein [Lachnospiraceae bacterium]
MKIVLKNLTKKFPNRNKKAGGDVTAVDDFNFEIPDGNLVGLLGPSGCGKSTTLNLISGLEKPTDGRVFFGEEDVTELPAMDRNVGLVFQSYALYPHLTVFKNIRFPLENFRGEKRLSKEEMEKRVLEAASLVQLEGLLERRPSELSGGQQQRVAIARALVKMPKVLLLDEPLSNLDARLRLQTREEIRRIQRETGITTIFVTHDQEEAMSICDLIVVMKSGAMMQMGRPQDVYDDPVNLFVAKFLGTPPINVFEGTVRDDLLYIGDDRIFRMIRPHKEGDVFVAVRPEGFIPDPDGPLKCEPGRLEVMGRDVSIVTGHKALKNESRLLRAIVSADNMEGFDLTRPAFRLKPAKVLIFDRDSEERIRFEVSDGQI